MKVSFLLAVLAIAASSTTVNAAPAPKLIDLHKTGMEVAKLGRSGETSHFMVTVTRNDKLVDVDDKGHVNNVAASRLTKVELTFDVSPRGKVTVNGEPVKMGVSTVHVKTKVVTAISKSQLKVHSHNEIKEAFEEGIVAVRLSVKGSEIKLPGSHINVQRIIIKETVLEINGKAVHQSDAIQQVVDIHADGTVTKHSPSAVASSGFEMIEDVSEKPLFKSAFERAAKVKNWYHKQTSYFKAFISLIFGAIIGGIVLLTLRIGYLLFNEINGHAHLGQDGSNRAITNHDDEDNEEKGLINGKKKSEAFSHDEPLPAYKEKEAMTDKTEEYTLPAYPAEK